MPARLSNIRASSRETTLREIPVRMGTDTLTIKYSRSDYTPSFERKFRNLQNANLPLGALAAFVDNLIREWDLVDEIDTVENLSLPEDRRQFFPVPCSRLTLELFGAPILEQIVEAIAEDNNPKKRTLQATEDF